MIEYTYKEEPLVALYFARELQDSFAEKIISSGEVSSEDEAIHLSKFFWAMVNRSATSSVNLPCEGSSQYWTEKLYNSFGGYLERIGYESIWDQEIDNA